MKGEHPSWWQAILFIVIGYAMAFFIWWRSGSFVELGLMMFATLFVLMVWCLAWYAQRADPFKEPANVKENAQ